MLNHMPQPFVPRQIQRDILEQIEQKIASGYKKIILCAPTGVGKSLVGVTMARHFGDSFIITASKNLQNQYVKDFNFLKSVKGKSNFPCHLIMAEKKMDDPIFAVRDGMTCEKGQCVTKKVVDGKTESNICRFKPTIQEVETKDITSETCKYYLQKYQGLVHEHSLWNYASFFQILKFNKDVFSKYLQKQVAIFDEAHTIEEQIVQFVGYDIRRRQAEDAEIAIDRYDLDDTDDIISIITDISKHYSSRIREIEETTDPETHPEYNSLSRLQRNYEDAAQAKVNITADKENFVANRPETDMDGNIKSISIKPVDISGYLEEFLVAENNMFMSATIDKTSFCENMGLDSDKVAIIDTPKSPFPKENRAVEIARIRHLNYKSTSDDEAAVINAIDEIMDRYSDKRGLILTSSISRCFNILNGLSTPNKHRVRICHSINQGGKTQDEVIQEHRDDPTGVLLSSSLWEGVDLKDDMSRFQIIAKVPYPNYAENRTRIKMRKFPNWYQARTLTKMLQGMGRSVRNDKDWAKTYILDAAVDKLLRMKSMIPKSYHDVLEINTIDN